MPIEPYNSVGGFSVGTGNSLVIDSGGGFSGAGATFSNRVALVSGMTAQSIYVSQGATFNSKIAGINGATFGAAVTIQGGTAWHSLNDGEDSGLDADRIHTVVGHRFLENLQTGLLYGGVLSINAGVTSTFDVSAGEGIIVDVNATTGSAPNPIVSTVTWPTSTGLTLSGLTSQDITYVSINSSGNVVQSATHFSDSAYETSIPLGALIHPTRSYISFAKSYPHVAYAQAAQFDPFIRSFGPMKLSGHEILGYGSTLQLTRSSGTAYALGRNYVNDPESPNVVTDTNANPATTVYRLYQNGTGGFTTVIDNDVDPTKYDDGTGTLASVPSDKWTIQRIFYYPNQASFLAIYYGRAYYDSLAAAEAALPYEQFSEIEDTAENAILCAYLFIKSNITNFSATSDYLFLQAGLFRSTTNVGSGGVAVTAIDDLTDVVITSATNNQVLRYDTGTSSWVNSSISSIYSPPIASASVTGVASFGDEFVVSAAGAVSLTGNYVKSFNGSTGAVSYAPPLATTSITGVASFNSSDFTVSGAGAVSLSNVARTNAANTFSSLQTFNAGITSQSLYVAQGATFNGNVRINGNLTVGDAVADTVTLPSGQIVKTYTSTTTSTSQFTLASGGSLDNPSGGGYACADVLVQAEYGDALNGTSGLVSTRFMIVAEPNSATVDFNQYGLVKVGSNVATFTVDYSGSEWRLRATPATTSSVTFRAYVIASPIIGGLMA